MGLIDESKSTVMTNLRRVIEFAKANGFPDAEVAGWISGEPDGVLPPDELDDNMAGDEVRSVDMGIYLHSRVHLTHRYDEARDEYETIAHDSRDDAEQTLAPLFTAAS